MSGRDVGVEADTQKPANREADRSDGYAAEIYPGVIKAQRSDVALYDPAEGLETIAVAEVGEKYWARAKDPEKLFKAIEAKLIEQAKYVVWRDRLTAAHVKPKHDGPGGKTSDLKSYLPAADPGGTTAHRWRKSFCAKDGNGNPIINEDKLLTALEDARHRCQRICEQEPKGTERGTAGTGEFERYTPFECVEAAREVMGGIDLDPATCEQAQQTVQATNYFTAETDGLDREWHGRVWLNPPYHRDLGPKFINKLVAEIESGRVTSAVMLTNNSANTEWYLTALRACNGLCVTHGRIHFTQPNGQEVLPTQGQAFFYFGSDLQKFSDVFCSIGPCLTLHRDYAKAPSACLGEASP